MEAVAARVLQQPRKRRLDSAKPNGDLPPSRVPSTSAAAGGTPLYRFYQPAKGVHFYTISAAERDYIIANSPSYRYEGIGYYAWTGL